MIEVTPEEAIKWRWFCPKDTCDTQNHTSETEIEWRDTTPVVVCEGCETKYIFKF